MIETRDINNNKMTFTTMYPITIKNNRCLLGNSDILNIAKEYGTPTYVYSLDVIDEKYESLKRYIEWPKLKIFYAMKANSNIDTLKFLKVKGASIDAVSYGDILLALKAGFKPENIIYTANNITEEEMDLAVKSKVLMNIGELSRLEKFGKKYPGSKVCIRINPEVESGEHKFLKTAGKASKFGILPEYINDVKHTCKKYDLRVIGIHEHTGSGIYNTKDFFSSIDKTLEIARQFGELKFVDFGGGFKVKYHPDEKPIDYKRFGKELTRRFNKFCKSYGRELELYFEPGKYLVAESGILLVEVNTMKNNNGLIFAGVNSGFPQLIRPILYQAYHHIINCSNQGGKSKTYTITGNICEGGDIFAKDRKIPEIHEKDILAIQNAGAYGYSMASTYNNRPLPAEVIIQNGKARLSRKRMSFKELVEKI